MAVAPPVRVPTPRLKAGPISATSQETATAITSRAQLPTRRAPRLLPKRQVHSSPADYLSDRATAVLIRRTLCPQQLGDKDRATPAPIEELLPPLTSRNDVDLQLYAFLAIILRDFVQSWYSRITPDETFVEEVVQIIAHCTRALEQRLRKVDLESLVFDELPDLLDRHVAAYRASRNPIARPPTVVDSRDIYHSMCPLVPLSPVPKSSSPSSIAEQQENEAAYRQLLVQGVLAILLPTEDLENPCLTALVGQIFSELIIGNIIDKRASQPWLLWEGISILAGVVRRRLSGEREDDPKADLSAATPSSKQSSAWSLQNILLSVLHWIVLASMAIRIVVTTFVTSSSLPRRVRQQDNASRKGLSQSKAHIDSINTSEPDNVPITSFRIWNCASNLIELDTRMPWLGSAISMVQFGALKGPGQIGRLDGRVDRVLSHFIHHYVLDPSLLSQLLRTLRGVLFPNNALGQPTMVAPENEEELLTLRRKCAKSLLALVPNWVARRYFGTTRRSRQSFARADEISDDVDEERILSEIEEGILDVFSDDYCNKHLMYSALELILIRLMPELAEKGIVELWEERLS